MATFDLTQPEVWYPIPGFDTYQLSSHLRLKSFHTGPTKHRRREPRIVKVHTDDRGYRKLILWKDKYYHNVYLHHMVALLAFGPCPAGMIVRHLDDDKSNNWPSNLAYGTQVENMADAKRNGTINMARGERRNTTLTDAAALAIKRLYAYGVGVPVLTKAFGLNRRVVYSIVSGERWTHIPDDADSI